MILNSISLAGFRTYADPVCVGPFDERITVIHAPNGTGKTTLLDGLYAALLESHSVSGAQAEASMRSANRNIVPTVTIEFSSDGRHFKVEKHFLRNASAKLYEFIGGAFTLISEDESVTEFTRGLLSAAKPGRGPIKYEQHFGLGSILWAPQGHVTLEPLPGDLVTTVRSRLGGEPAPSGLDGAVEASIIEWFAKFYSENGKERTAIGSADLPALRDRVNQGRAALANAKMELERIDALRSAVENAADDELRWNTDCEAMGAQLANLEGQVTAFKTASAALIEAKGAFQTAKEQHDNADVAIRAIDKARAAVNGAEQAERERREELDAAAATESATRAQFDAASVAADAASKALDTARAQSSIASDARTLVTERRAIARYEEQITAAEKRAKTVLDLRDRMARILAPSTEQMKDIRSKYAAIDRLRVQLASGALRVVYTPAANEGISLSAGTLLAGSHATPGLPIEVVGSPSVEFAIEGAGTIRAVGPSESSEALRGKLSLAETAFIDLTRPFGTSDLSELERRAGEANGIESRLDALRPDVEPAATPLEDLRSQLEEARATVARLAALYPEWELSEPNAESLSQSASALETDARLAYDATAATRDIAQTSLNDATKAREKSREAHAKAKSALDNAIGSLSALEDDGRDDNAREERLRELGLARLQITDRMEKAQAALAAYGTDPHDEYTNLEKTRAAAQTELHNASLLKARSKALLDAQSMAGCYENVARAEASLAEAEDQLRLAEQEAAAAKLLREIFTTVKQEREEQYLKPVRQRTAELYARVSNTAVADVRFERALALEGMMLGSTLLSSTLSGGESEQLNMVARLALADLLVQGERQLVILDDSLSVTDPHRFRRFLGIVREFAQERMQFVIATCDKARYLSLTEAKFIDLEEVRRPSALAS
jgi:energy-coupling factor transporter ATP-binding protein EcfA2